MTDTSRKVATTITGASVLRTVPPVANSNPTPPAPQPVQIPVTNKFPPERLKNRADLVAVHAGLLGGVEAVASDILEAMQSVVPTDSAMCPPR